MKFLCDNCKAKYQIADEKVVGKTVRMKCRKCGHQIEVRAAVTESSVSSLPPRPPAAPPKAGLATSLSAAKPRAPTPTPAGTPSGALAGAFQRNVQETAPNISLGLEGPASIELSDEWYVAINGVPVGPVRISELRRKAAGGAVTEESLCWQEGLEEWRPVRSIPELAALVREAALGNRPSLTSSPDPLTSRPSVPPPPPPRPPPPAPRTSAPPPAPRAAPAPTTGRNNVVPLRPAASIGLDELSVGGSGSAAAFASVPAPAETAPMLQTPPSVRAVPVPVADPFATPPAPIVSPAAAAVPSMQPAPEVSRDFDQAGRKGGVPLWFWPVLVLALGFGGGVAFLVFRPQPAPAPVVIQMPQQAPTTTAAPTADKNDAPPPTISAEPAAPTDPKSKTGPVVASRGTAAPKATAAAEEKKGLDLGNLVPGGGGPNVGPSTSPGGGSGGGLDQAGVERVVAVHRNGVKRTCWERGGGDQKSSVNVTITANVAPNGTVASTSSTGDDPVVAKCIETQVKNWQFPAPGSNTTINIPFKFVRQ